ncbi:MAG: type II secretion system minor pseudopilin GspK [Porticoccaceae bacterium]|nr:type II secretion system minor pseudopilin GspK [Porticoccaceae bacterium]
MISGTPSRQQGIALLAAMILMLAITMILANIFYRHQLEVSQAAASLHRDQALLIALSGESWAIELLAEDATNSQTNDADHYGEIWAQALPMLPVEGGTLTGCISDLQSKVDLNNFSSYQAGLLQSELNQYDNVGFAKLWLNLLDILEIPSSPARIATIVDWIDNDSTVVNSWGAEQPDYDSFNPPRVVANSFLVESAELADISGYTIAEVLALLPWITVLSEPSRSGSQSGQGRPWTPVNINTASDELLFALGGRFGEQFVDAVKLGRPFRANQIHDLLNDALGLRDPITNVGRANTIWPDTLISHKTDYFQLYLVAKIGEAHMEVTSLISRKTLPGQVSRPRVLGREITLIPSMVPSESKASELKKMVANNDQDMSSDEQLEEQNTAVQPACVMVGVY